MVIKNCTLCYQPVTRFIIFYISQGHSVCEYIKHILLLGDISLLKSSFLNKSSITI